MKYLLLLLPMLLVSNRSVAQNSNELKEWQTNHPNKILMHFDVYIALSASQQVLLAGKIVIIEDLNPSDTNLNRMSVDTAIETEFQDNNFVKRWLAENGSVKIVKRSEYNAASDAQRAIYDQGYILVLAGETLTQNDIENY